MESPRKSIVIKDLLISFKHYLPKNNHNDEKLIFLHGWGSELSVWNSVATELMEMNYESFAIDLPGFGLSQKPATAFAISDYANILIEFIKKFELDNVVLVGHSFGGAVSIKISSQNLPEIKKIVLVDNSGIRLKRESLTIAALGAKIVRPIFAPAFMQPLRRKIYKAIGNEDYLDSGEMKNTYLNVIEDDLTPLLSEIKIPALIIWGEKDKDTPLWMGRKLKQEIRDSRLEILEGAGHYSFLDKPEEFKKILVEFIL